MRLIVDLYVHRNVWTGSEPDQVHQRVFDGTAGRPQPSESDAIGQVDLDQQSHGHSDAGRWLRDEVQCLRG